MPHSWKSQQQRPSSGYGPGTLAIGLRIVYAGKKAKRFPRAACQPCLLDPSQRTILLDDLAHLSRKIGGANPRKDDTQVSGVLQGCVEVIWPELRKSTTRYEDILSEMSRLNTLPSDVLADRSISCLIVYSLPPTTTSLSRYQPWDEPCLLVVDSGTVDRSLEAQCRASLNPEPRLDQALAKKQSSYDTTREYGNSKEELSSLRAGNRYTPPLPGSSRHGRSMILDRSPSHLPARPRSPMKQSRLRSRSSSHSPPRKRLKSSADDNGKNTLLEHVRQLERERDMAFNREDALRREFDSVSDESQAFRALKHQVEAWTAKAEYAERCVLDQEQRLHFVLDDHTTRFTGASALAKDASAFAMLENVMLDYRQRIQRSREQTAEIRSHYKKRIGALDAKGSSAEGDGLSNALAVVAQLAATIGI